MRHTVCDLTRSNRRKLAWAPPSQQSTKPGPVHLLVTDPVKHEVYDNYMRP